MLSESLANTKDYNSRNYNLEMQNDSLAITSASCLQAALRRLLAQDMRGVGYTICWNTSGPHGYVIRFNTDGSPEKRWASTGGPQGDV